MEGREQVPVIPAPGDVRQVVLPVADRAQVPREAPIVRQNENAEANAEANAPQPPAQEVTKSSFIFIL